MTQLNEKFAAATTGMAFMLTLSARQCNTLLRLAEAESCGDPRAAERMRLWVIGVDGLNGLYRRGLVFWHQDADGKPNGFGGMTEAGRVVVSLLKIAGMSVEGTNTPMVQRRMERYSERSTA